MLTAQQQQQQPHGRAAAAAAAASPSLPAGAPSSTQFALPVDAECKACRMDLCSLARPHMRAFHISWLAFFLTFLATFAPAALLPVLRDSLDLTNTDIGNGGIASVCGAIAARLLIGTFTDVFGPRYAAALVLLGTAPFVFGMALIKNAAGFVAMRMLVGLSLSMFVVNQSWTTNMFNTKLVGRANALSAGWGNCGAGATLLLMPLLFEAFSQLMGPNMAWRVAFFVPGGLQLLLGVMVLTLADDSPMGPLAGRDHAHLRRTHPCHSWQAVLLNYRSYLITLGYALSFGVELTTHNVISFYLYNHFQLSLTLAGTLGGVLGLMNVCSRFFGGAASDLAASLHGMRGRLWVLQVLLLVEGLFCLLVGIAHASFPATLGMLFAFSFSCQMACGAVFGIVPFVSRRSTGMVVGMVAGGGSLGSAVTQAIFFSYFDFTPYEGFYWMGTTVICLGAFMSLLHWPMWGGMFCGAQSGMSEERYYMAEYSNTERAAGLHLPALAFAHESRSERDTAGCFSRACPLMTMPRRSRQNDAVPNDARTRAHSRDPSVGGCSMYSWGGSSHIRAGGLLPQYLQLTVPCDAAVPPPFPLDGVQAAAAAALEEGDDDAIHSRTNVAGAISACDAAQLPGPDSLYVGVTAGAHAQRLCAATGAARVPHEGAAAAATAAAAAAADQRVRSEPVQQSESTS